MKQTVSYKAKIHQKNRSLQPTLDIYRQAVTFIVDVIHSEWSNLKGLKLKESYNKVENLIHTTKNNKATYPFDVKFVKFPSYLRRAATADAYGVVSSYQSNYDNWVISKIGKAPTLSLKHYKCPALYKGNMFNRIDQYTYAIKIYNGKEWVWTSVALRKTDVDYIEKVKHSKLFSPLLIKKGRAFYLQFACEVECSLPKETNRVVSVDLGLNTIATCSVVCKDGTIQDRKFIHFPREIARQETLCNKLKKAQKQGGRKATNAGLWAKINHINDELVNKTVLSIVRFAKNNGCGTIVFEHLNFKGRYSKNIALKMQLWRKRGIIEKATTKAHLYHIRVATVSPRNTSKLAYDGSGIVKRDNDNYSLCTFTSGKHYNADLNAAYNIGARYFIRAMKKAMSEKTWLQAQAKVPELSKRTLCTLSTLRLVAAFKTGSSAVGLTS